MNDFIFVVLSDIRYPWTISLDGVSSLLNLLNETFIYGHGVWTPFTPATDQMSAPVELEFGMHLYM